MSGFDPIQALKDKGAPVPEPLSADDSGTPLTDQMIAEMDDPKSNPAERPLELTPDMQPPLTGTEKGVKLDTGKTPMWRGVMSYFAKALLAVGAISEFGSRKYIWGGWRTVDDGFNRYSDAQMRHMMAEASGELYDPETGMLHAAHAAWGALARLEKLLEEQPLHKPD